MGLVGFGDIAQATARIAKHGFGMKVVAMRRQKGGDPTGLADACYSSEVPEERLQVTFRSLLHLAPRVVSPVTFPRCALPAGVPRLRLRRVLAPRNARHPPHGRPRAGRLHPEFMLVSSADKPEYTPAARSAASRSSLP